MLTNDEQTAREFAREYGPVIRKPLRNTDYQDADGLQSCKEYADYDAIVATCAVRVVPPSWFGQLTDGGSITTALSGWMPAGGLIRLVLYEEGTAHGRFTEDTVSYMLARPHGRPRPRRTSGWAETPVQPVSTWASWGGGRLASSRNSRLCRAS
ncbi:hypothetical protein [Streptomyces sulphureus]|uniref:hypothetical protein n=1 Tax=Streptomyces sulphureus TaxID=47758 RepID=UPI0003A754A4